MYLNFYNLRTCTHRVVANIFPPTFNLTQSCREAASGVGSVDVRLNTKSIGSVDLWAALPPVASLESRSGVDGVLVFGVEGVWSEAC